MLTMIGPKVFWFSESLVVNAAEATTDKLTDWGGGGGETVWELPPFPPEATATTYAEQEEDQRECRRPCS